MRETLRISALQHAPTPEALDVSLQRIAHYATVAADADNDLLLVPEASVTGYNISLESAKRMAERRDGNAFGQLSAIARRNAIALVYGYIERDGDDLYNSVQFIDDTGQAIGHYRKTHLWGELDQQLFQPGESFAPLVDYHGWKVGLLICYDVEFPEAVRHLALSGAELVLVPTALMHPWDFVATHIVRVRAAENQVFLAYANYCGEENSLEYAGKSCIAGPDGESLARAEHDETLLQATLARQAINDIRQSLPYHKDRRESLYQSHAATARND